MYRRLYKRAKKNIKKKKSKWPRTRTSKKELTLALPYLTWAFLPQLHFDDCVDPVGNGLVHVFEQRHLQLSTSNEKGENKMRKRIRKKKWFSEWETPRQKKKKKKTDKKYSGFKEHSPKHCDVPPGHLAQHAHGTRLVFRWFCAQ